MEEAVLSSHNEGGVEVTLACPEGWQEVEGLLGTLVAFVAPAEDEESFRPNFNVVVQPAEAQMPFELLHGSHGAELADALDHARVIDSSVCSVGGRASSRALVAYAQNAWDLTLEQWIVPFQGRNLVLSATCQSVEYAALAPLMDEIIQSASFANA